MSYSNNFNFPVLIISDGGGQLNSDHPLYRVQEMLERDNHHFIYAYNQKSALAMLRNQLGIGCIIIHDDDHSKRDDNELFLKHIIRSVRARNHGVPIFFSSISSMLGRLPTEVIKELHEYINVYEDTPKFIAGRIHLAVEQYISNLLPPYFAALKNYALDSPYYWDCPGHQGGVAYLKHPVGREFINFFGENLMRADIGISTPELGDWLEHKGVPGEAEKRAAKVFGADRTFFVTGGSSQSNQIVGHSIDLKDKVILLDRNCHKSVNHELTITRAKPVYFQPSRNGLGIIGLISPNQFTRGAIEKKITDSVLTYSIEDQDPAYAIITNCTYDGLIYDVTTLAKKLGKVVPRIKFDEAWYAYAKFHPLYQGRFAMGVPKDKKNGPTIYAVQSTHKMLAALSSASMVHIRNSARAPVDYDAFNQSFMMHGTTSPFYPIIASMDVATAMMEGESGKSLVDEAIHDAISFRKTLVTVSEKLDAEEGDWFFDVWQPASVPVDGEQVPFALVDDDILATRQECWYLRAGDAWHGFEDLPEGYAMLDPIKVTITCPGLDSQGVTSDFGIPAPVVVKYLDTQRIIPARNGDYTILVLFALGSTQGKWNTLIDTLMMFKYHHDTNTPLAEILPDISARYACYQGMGLGDLCRAIHYANIELKVAELLELACTVEAIPVLAPSQAYECLIANQTELVKIEDMYNRTLGVMITPYPPGIPLIMPGEKVTEESRPIIDYLTALQTFGQRFPGFEHELQGVDVDDDGFYWVRCIKEEPLTRKSVSGVMPVSCSEC
ncbi:Orn/Lys/Arg decarboxylase N-terminal domain-containing protein [Serratia rhizosphaerae]|uniref:Arginine decarboxylase n=1 Tax=Serratia rhizosphaerae TaxID=2597702 RepID=A0ABX6GLR5_9GAMM|nr:Orn/Lys/Arg decarboxylase N-terminal domain-containing protein [Serratia rhizosphaerae]QHA87192.1 arginine decarboxylase [Serratia rhizosphaerae]